MTRPNDLQTAAHLDEVQDENGTDLSLLRQNLRLSVQERLERLQEHQRQVELLRGRARSE